ncbi:MAG: FG-GAP-like repeat-containing protein, partial [Pseudomonadota bacterium]
MPDTTAPHGALLFTPVFTTPVINPYGLTNGSNYSNASFVDIDNDGDLDAFIGATAGETSFYRNTGSSSSPAFSTPAVNPFGLLDNGSFSSPNFVDIDADGDLDALIGFRDGMIRLQLNTGTSSSPAFSTTAATDPFGLSDAGNSAMPAFADIDADGDLDAFVGNGDGDTLVFLNTGSAGSPAFATALTNPYGLSDIGDYANVNLADIDADGDLDAFIGEFLGNTLFFRNTGTASSPAFATSVLNPFGLVDVGSSASANFVDIDGDGDLDALLGQRFGNTLVFLNSANPVAPVTTTNGNGTYAIGSSITLQIAFSESVIVNTAGGTPTLALSSGGSATFTGGSGSSILTFSYTVQAGHSSADLDYTSTSALSLNGATIRDAAGNNAILTLASPGTAGSLGANAALVIDGIAPTLSITSGVSTLKVGETAEITFTFSEDPG